MGWWDSLPSELQGALVGGAIALIAITFEIWRFLGNSLENRISLAVNAAIGDKIATIVTMSDRVSEAANRAEAAAGDVEAMHDEVRNDVEEITAYIESVRTEVQESLNLLQESVSSLGQTADSVEAARISRSSRAHRGWIRKFIRS